MRDIETGNPKFHKRVMGGSNSLPPGYKPVPDPRFYKEKAQRMNRVSVVSEEQEESIIDASVKIEDPEPSIFEELGQEVEPQEETTTGRKWGKKQKESEEISANDIDI